MARSFEPIADVWLRGHPYPREAWFDAGTERWTRIPLFLHVRAVKR